MLQARPRAWASLTQNPGAQLPQPGTQPLPQQFLQHHRLQLRVVQDGEQLGTHDQRLPTHLLALSLISPRQHNQIKGTPASRQDGTAGQPLHKGTGSVPAQATGHAERAAEMLHFPAAYRVYLDPAFPSQSRQHNELTAPDSNPHLI